jgi:hypothetical protein
MREIGLFSLPRRVLSTGPDGLNIAALESLPLTVARPGKSIFPCVLDQSGNGERRSNGV